MQRKKSRMTSVGLLDFVNRFQSRRKAADALGISERALYAYLKGDRQIPRTMALLIHALDRLRERNSSPADID